MSGKRLTLYSIWLMGPRFIFFVLGCLLIRQSIMELAATGWKADLMRQAGFEVPESSFDPVGTVQPLLYPAEPISTWKDERPGQLVERDGKMVVITGDEAPGQYEVLVEPPAEDAAQELRPAMLAASVGGAVFFTGCFVATFFLGRKEEGAPASDRERPHDYVTYRN